MKLQTSPQTVFSNIVMIVFFYFNISLFAVFSCKSDCSKKLSEDEKLDLFTKFYDLSSKDIQDVFLTGLMECSEVCRRRTKTKSDHTRSRESSFKYYASRKEKAAGVSGDVH